MDWKALQINQSLSNANMNLGAILKDQGLYNEAFYYAKKELEISPKAEAPYNLLTSLLKDCDIKMLTAQEIRVTLRLIIDRKDICHSDLFSVFNELINKDLLDV